MMPRVLMVAAENDALPPVRTDAGVISAKVGGIGDVVREVPAALYLTQLYAPPCGQSLA